MADNADNTRRLHSVVLDNGTNIGSAHAKKATIPSGEPFVMERRPSSGAGSRKSSFSAGVDAGFGMSSLDGPSRPSPSLSRRSSRRGSGTIVTPSGQQVVYHTRTQEETEFPHAEKS